jgi:hypothetical protein
MKIRIRKMIKSRSKRKIRIRSVQSLDPSWILSDCDVLPN